MIRTAVLLALVVALAAPAAAEETGPLNVVLIMADDLGAAELGCYGHEKHTTPRLDRLAAEGMRFETCWATPLCTPTRVMLLTGRYAWRTGWFDLIGRALTPRKSSYLQDVSTWKTFAHVLKDGGYATAHAGKWQLPGALPDLVHEAGFDEYRMWAYDHNLPKGIRHEGRERKDGRGPTSRFWHPAILENGEYETTTEVDYGPELYTDFLIDFIRRHQTSRFLAYYPMCLTHTPWAPTPDSDQPGGKTKGGLPANLAELDRQVGRLVDAIDELGLADRTLILFTADNGTQGRGKGKVTEAGVRVPLIARCPGTVPAGEVRSTLVSLADMYPTALACAHLDLPHGHEIDGVNLLPTLCGEDVEHRQWIYSFYKEQAMVRTATWMLDGKGKLYDCAWNRSKRGYRHIKPGDEAKDEEAQQARAKLEAILASIPGPDALREQLIPKGPKGNKGGKRNKR